MLSHIGSGMTTPPEEISSSAIDITDEMNALLTPTNIVGQYIRRHNE